MDHETTVLEPENEAPQHPRSTKPPKRARYVALVIVLGLIVAAIVVFSSRLGERRALAKETEELAVPNVVVIQPKAEPSQQEFVLPSSLQAFTESPIYARTTGYLAHWYTDIGSKLTKGQLLADIDTPEVDQELSQARAVRSQAEAQLGLAKSSAERW